MSAKSLLTPVAYAPALIVDKTAVNSTMTVAMFVEFNRDKQAEPEVIFTTKDQHQKNDDGKIFYSLKKLYIEDRDPTEILFANKYFVNWDHWTRVCNSFHIKPAIISAREELALILKAEAYAKILAIANDPTHRMHYNALRFIESNGWMDSTAKSTEIRKVGRPKKDTLGPEMLSSNEDYARLSKLL